MYHVWRYQHYSRLYLRVFFYPNSWRLGRQRASRCSMPWPEVSPTRCWTPSGPSPLSTESRTPSLGTVTRSQDHKIRRGWVKTIQVGLSERRPGFDSGFSRASNRRFTPANLSLILGIFSLQAPSPVDDRWVYWTCPLLRILGSISEPGSTEVVVNIHVVI